MQKQKIVLGQARGACPKDNFPIITLSFPVIYGLNSGSKN
jgi:hypothetical protein